MISWLRNRFRCLCLFASSQVLRAQNLVSAESAQSGQGHPGTVYPLGGNPTSQERMALPEGLRHSVPLSESNMSARQKIQAKIDNERFIKPTPKDTTRFQPKQVVKVCFELYVTCLCLAGLNCPMYYRPVIIWASKRNDFASTAPRNRLTILAPLFLSNQK